MDTDTHNDRRFAAALPAVLHHGGADFPCSARDLGREGVLLVGELPDPDAPDLEVTVRTPTGDLELRLQARLAFYRKDGADAPAKLALQFQELAGEQREKLDLMLSRVLEGMAPAGLDSLSRGATVAKVRQVLSAIPVAHRIALARRAQAREREFLKHDTDPLVLESLVRNPNIVLPEIVALARMPHLLPTTVEIMANDPRWANSDEVKILLATHPRATFSTTDKLVSRLPDLLLQRVIHRPGLHPAVREKVMRRLSRKHRG
jgi:hypothetical protein